MKRMQLNRRRLVALGLPIALAACGSSPNPVLYTIAVKQGAVLPAGPRIVLLRDIGLAGYLDRKEIVRSSADYRLAVQSNDWWGEPLGPLIGRVLVVELSQRLPASNVYAEGGAISADPNATVAVNIQRIDVDQNGVLVLLAQAVVDFNRPTRTAARTFSITRPVSPASIAGQVASMSDALGELADGLAQMLQPS
jgi:uncharacterized lipoprotein YmbA